MSFKQKLIQVINDVHAVSDEKWNPGTYFQTSVTSSDGKIDARYLLGSLYVKGYSEAEEVNFEIFKDHSSWQIWIWDFAGAKDPNKNNYSAPWSPDRSTDDVITFIEKNL